MRKDYWVTVCSNCMTAACWQGEFYCESWKTSGTKRVLASAHRAAKREHSSYFTRKRLIEVAGHVEDAT